jgi:hypothetical protein
LKYLVPLAISRMATREIDRTGEEIPDLGIRISDFIPALLCSDPGISQ